MNRALFVVLLAAAGCTGGIKHTVPDSELAILGGQGMEAIDAAAKEEASARQALEARQLEEKAAVREVKIAEQAIRRDDAALAVARLRFEAVQETHDADAMLPANARRAQAEHALATSKAELVFRQAARDHATARVEEGEAAVDVALARVERAKLEAVLGGEGTLLPKQAERKAAFEVQLSKAQAALADRSARVVKAKGAMEAAEGDWKALAASKP
jgi:hypothetical protein